MASSAIPISYGDVAATTFSIGVNPLTVTEAEGFGVKCGKVCTISLDMRFSQLAVHGEIVATGLPKPLSPFHFSTVSDKSRTMCRFNIDENGTIRHYYPVQTDVGTWTTINLCYIME